ncbi:hypothetical protein CGCSCA4_v009499 [Colletotrichum siamense]|uniref:DUF2264 domain-containing protein n=1 Tax=Colletotrichum siamense TaxID=690259 RepID=A0A9P5EMY6_COLSI|nr:hypothetical protein CGCSCA4_v009499 [Colletotrichum siamense]KAF4854684.1 hypothetical protein CGCSCA2_v009373 [Colletotrichum siamense]
MSPLPGFSDNPLKSRDDVVRATEALIKPLIQYFSHGKARIKLPVATGTHFDENAAQLEGFARPLWAVGALLMSGDPNWELVQPWIDGFDAGVDPDHPEYWGDIQDYDQRMVEAEMISFALLAAPRHMLWDRLRPETRKNLVTWLSSTNTKLVHRANWLWFRVFTNLALSRVCNVDTPEVRDQIEDDLKVLDTFYLEDGWSSDGLWRTPDIDDEEYRVFRETGRANAPSNGRNACFYSGSFAIQFSQLLYVRFAGDRDPARTAKYQQQARDFGAGFWRFFNFNGAVIPFGRSLTYRFAAAGFFAALALADVPNMPAPLASPGAVKGFLLRHLRWWANNSEDIFFPDGTLNLGWVYPNMYLTEDYNSPQSPYWCLKSLVVVALSSNNAFWTDPEVPYPDVSTDSGIKLLPAPRQIFCNHPRGNHHFMLSTAQFMGVTFKGHQAKYCKFAYSSSFGFSVPTTQATLHQVAPDNALIFSRDGMETWAGKYKCGDTTYGTAVVHGKANEEVVSATVEWFPWADRSVTVTTTLLPPTQRWPDWHVRVHHIKAAGPLGRLFTAEGGFAINGHQQRNTRNLLEMADDDFNDAYELGQAELIIIGANSVLILGESGASGISADVISSASMSTKFSPLKPEANTNIMTQRSLIPMIESNIISLGRIDDVIIVTKVFAISSNAYLARGGQARSLRQRWADQPSIRLMNTRGQIQTSEDFISL